MAATNGYITPRTFRFLRELAANNNREWFNDNKQRYIEEVRDPMLAFIDAFRPRLAKITAHLVADARPVGGSLMRVYRDTRFAKDKSPYKTNVGVAFRHIAGRDVHGPVFYLHLEPGASFATGGMWHPASDALQRVREAIVAQPERWKRAVRRAGIDDDHDRLKRPPRGFDPDHPLIEDLKRKSFTSSRQLTEKDACAPGFLNEFAKSCRQRAPLLEFLSEAVGVDW